MSRSATLLAAIFAVALVGCGGDDGGGETTTAAKETTAAQTTAPGGDDRGSADESGGGSSQDGGEAQGFSAQIEVSDAPEPGAEEAAPGVPTHRGVDNSIQLWGSEGSDEDRYAAAEALQVFFNARATGDVALMCAHVSPKLVSDLAAQLGGDGQGKPSCPQLLRFAVSPNADRSVLRAEARDLRVLSFRVDDEEQGFVIYRDRAGAVWAFPMNKDAEGEWKVSLLGPSPIAG